MAAPTARVKGSVGRGTPLTEHPLLLPRVRTLWCQLLHTISSYFGDPDLSPGLWTAVLVEGKRACSWSLRVRPWPPLRATTPQPHVRRAAQFHPRMVMPTAPHQGHPNTSMLGAGVVQIPSGSFSRRPREPPSTLRSWRLPGPQGGRACPAPRRPTLTSGTQSSVPGPSLLHR